MTDKEFIKTMETIAGRELSDYEKMFCLMVKEGDFVKLKGMNNDGEKELSRNE